MMRRLAPIWIAAALGLAGPAAVSAYDAEQGAPSPIVIPGDEPAIGDEVPSAVATTVFLRAAGSNFHPRESTTTYSYAGGGCMQRSSGAGDSWFSYDLDLPDGAVIDFLRVYFYDNNATYDVNSELWAFDGAGGATLIAEADSSGTPGYSSAGSDFFSHQVSTMDESLVVVASIQGSGGSSLTLCGMRVRYQYDATQIFSDGFEAGNTSAWSSTFP